MEGKQVFQRIPRIQFGHRKTRRNEEPKPPSPVSIYYMVLFPAIILTFVGLLMTFSATSVSNISSGVNPYAAFARTAIIIVLSLVAAGFVSYSPPSLVNQLAGTAYAIGAFLQLLVIPFGIEAGGNTNWLAIPGTQQMIQPSELLKLATVLMMARGLTMPSTDLTNWKQVGMRAGLPALISIALVMAGQDMGTALVFAVLAIGALWVAGVPRMWFVWIGLIGVFAAAILVGMNPSRLRRVMEVFSFDNEVDLTSTTQSDHALWALGSGGLFGLGPGASREKWDYLQEAHTDFILAIIGEEFGLVGTLTLLATMVALIWAMLRVASFGSTSFVRIGAGGIASWIGFQAFVNVGTVTGLLPVIGVPFPLVSYGGSSFLATALAIGIMLCFVRSEAGFKQASRFSATTGGRDPRFAPARRLVWSRLGKKSPNTQKGRTAVSRNNQSGRNRGADVDSDEGWGTLTVPRSGKPGRQRVERRRRIVEEARRSQAKTASSTKARPKARPKARTKTETPGRNEDE